LLLTKDRPATSPTVVDKKLTTLVILIMHLDIIKRGVSVNVTTSNAYCDYNLWRVSALPWRTENESLKRDGLWPIKRRDGRAGNSRLRLSDK